MNIGLIAEMINKDLSIQNDRVEFLEKMNERNGL